MKRAAIILCVLAGLAFQSGWRPVTRAEDFASEPRAGQGAGCRAAVARLQTAVTTEAHAYADARRTFCQYKSLSADMQEGRPQAINDSMQRNLSEARRASAAASNAAAGCDTSGVKRPRVLDQGSFAAYNACTATSPVLSCDRLNGDAYIRCLNEQEKRKYARWQECQGLLSQVDCSVKVVEEDGQTGDEGEQVVTLPADLNPECRDAYLQFVNAERERVLAQKRLQDITPKFGAAGARGTAMYNAARADLQRASEKKAEADRKLRACRALDDSGDTKTATANQQAPPGERPCTADERTAFAKLTGSWKSYPMSISVGGSCEQTTGTYQVAEWCGDANGPDKSELYSGSFTGRMEGGGISVAWTQDAGKRHPKLTGQASCSLNGDGTLNCRGFGPPSCGPGDAKKQ